MEVSVKRIRNLAVGLAAIMLALIVLYACGNETPTATPTAVSGGNTPVAGNTPVENTPEANNTPVESTPGTTEPTPGNGTSGNSGEWKITPTSGTAGKIKMTVNSVRSGTEGHIPAESGTEYLTVNLTFENGTGEEQVMSSAALLDLKDDTGKTRTIAFGAKMEPQLESVNGGKLEPGGKVTGEVAYIIPMGAKLLTLDFKPILQDEVLTIKLER